jgi:NTP pyrophosphatase (non-canonical NTP hydrolase)
MQATALPQLSLDDLYKMVSRIYGEQNAQRPKSATFAHFVEVCGMLAVHSRNKKREGSTLEGALCKALAWYFPLMAKFHVSSVEDLIFRKYPFACPYCRREPHVDSICKNVRGTDPTVNHDAVRDMYKANEKRRPKSLNGWQQMFAAVYPRNLEDKESRSIVGLLEELGELGEAIRVFERFPKYFAGEAADVFSYLMGIANEHALKIEMHGGPPFSLEYEFIQRYPGLCVQCGFKVCVCPNVPQATVGRLAKELDLTDGTLFDFEVNEFNRSGEEAANRVLRSLGGYEAIADSFPFDRGQANKALVTVCLRIASTLDSEDPVAAEKLRSAAVQLSQTSATPGTATHGDVASLLRDIAKVLPTNGSHQNILESLGRELQTRTINVLLVAPAPNDQDRLHLSREQRAIEKAIRQATRRDSITVTTLPSATIDDLRTEMMRQKYDVVHFLGHSDSKGLVFEAEDGSTTYVELENISSFFQSHQETECLVLNACNSLENVNSPIARVTVGMAAQVGDEAAIEFARGFYDALGEGKSFENAVQEGRHSAELKSLGKQLPLKILIRNTL